MELRGTKVFTWRMLLGFGFYIASVEDDPMIAVDDDGVYSQYLFDGLHALLPFIDLRYGIIWEPKPQTPAQQEDHSEK